MSDFPIVVLGDLVKIKGGKRLPKGSNLQTVTNNHPYIRVRDMRQRFIPEIGLEYVPDDVFPKIQRYIVEENDLIISIVGTIGLVSLIDERFHLASQTENCAKLSGLDQVDALYVYYYLSSFIGQQNIKKATVGAVQAKLPLYNIEKIPVIWPERKDRVLIVRNLCTFDDKIELNRQTNQTLEQIVQAIFKSWFVDFEPVKAKIAAKHTLTPTLSQRERELVVELAAMCAISGKTEEQLKGLDKDALQQLKTTTALFPDTLVESELGEIPEGWDVGIIGDLFELHRGFDLPKKDRKDGPYPVYAAGGYHGQHAEFKMEPPGIITGRSGVIGNVYLSLTKYWPLNTTLYVREFKRCGPYYAYFFLNMCDLKSINSGSAVPSLNRNFVHSVNSLMPDDSLLDIFEKFTSSSFVKIKSNDSEVELLSSLRDLLLPKLLSGDISLNNFNQDMEVAANG